jgi:hypothetical protein
MNPPRRPVFAHGSGQVGFVVDKMAPVELFITIPRLVIPSRIPYFYNFACGSEWVRNLVSDIKGGT